MTPQRSHLESVPETTDTELTTPFPYGDAEARFPLARYTSRSVLRPDGPIEAVGTAGTTACPACESETVNGAGLFTCTECFWTGSLR